MNFFIFSLSFKKCVRLLQLTKVGARWWEVVKSWQSWGKVVGSSKNVFSVSWKYIIWGYRDILPLRISPKKLMKFIICHIYNQ